MEDRKELFMESPKRIDRIWHYYLDAEGVVWHDGTELDDPWLLKFFMEKMVKLSNGQFQVICQGETCLIRVQDVPYVVQSIEISPKKIRLIFSGRYEEELNPATLVVGKENILYCKVREGEFDARFNRKSYLELTKQIEFDSEKKKYFLKLNERKYLIQGV